MRLIKHMKSKSAIELLGKMSFLELMSEIMASTHQQDLHSDPGPFSSYRGLHKNLRKIYHHKLVEAELKERKLSSGKKYAAFEEKLNEYKKDLYNKTYEMIVGSTYGPWEQFREKTLELSQGLKPLMINSGINSLMQEELENFHLDQDGTLGTEKLKEIYKGLRRIIILENLLMKLGFNSIFPSETHQEITELKDKLKTWYKSHLTLQALSYYLSDLPAPPGKYINWVKDLRNEKKDLSLKAEQQAKSLFDKLLV